MPHAYAYLYGLPGTGLRFFTVYGPFGRPDMALFTFTERILAGQAIDIYNYGHHQRDFPYIDDIVAGIVMALDHIAEPDAGWRGDAPDPASSQAPYRIYNIGSEKPIQIMCYVEVLEACLGRRAEKNFLPLQAGDIPDSWSDVGDLATELDYRPRTSVEEGVQRFVDWYLDYFNVGT